jgi:hypothetical protein
VPEVDRVQGRAVDDRPAAAQLGDLLRPGAQVVVVRQMRAGQLQQHRVVRPVLHLRQRRLGQHAGVGRPEQPGAVGPGEVVEDGRSGRGPAVAGGQHDDVVVGDGELVSGGDLDRLHGVVEVLASVGEHRRRPDQRQRPAPGRPAPPHPRRPGVVVRVGVRHQDRLHAGQVDALLQGASYAVVTHLEQQPVVDQRAGLTPQHPVTRRGAAGRAGAPGVGPAVGGAGAEHADAHADSQPHRDRLPTSTLRRTR